jgi:predicted PurR-regulated permease PerM
MNDGRNFTINISSGAIIKTILLFALFWVLFLIKDLVLVVLTAVVIASAVEPVTKWFGRRKFRRVPAVIIIYLLLVLLLVGFFLFFLPVVLNQAVVYLNSLPENLNLYDLWSPIGDAGIAPMADGVTGFAKHFSVREVVDGFKAVIAGTGEGVFKTASIIFGGALSFILIMVLSFYLAVQEDGVADFLKIITPSRHEKYVINLWKRTQMKIGYWMQGQLALGLIVGILVYIGLKLLGIEHALLLATLAALFELIPIFGPILASIPALLIGFDAGVSTGVLVLILYIIIHQFENHLLYPMVVKKIVGVSPIIVILSLAIGVKLAGFLGIILSVPISAAFMEYISDLEKNRVGADADAQIV